MLSEQETRALRLRCTQFLCNHAPSSPAQDFAKMSAWCAENQIDYDTYGEGDYLQAFEEKIAKLLGMEAALFCITGTLTQVTALRLACAERGNSLVALHPTSHILKHERSNFQLLQHFHALQIGDPFRPWTVADLQTLTDPVAAAQLELPMREIGGQLPSWDELNAIKNYCALHDIHLHMDGARLWEAGAGFKRDYADIAQGFDSVYVSFYKGIDGLGGAMLLGKSDFIAKANTWMKRQGGNVFRRAPFAIAAAMQFDQRIAAMPQYFERALWLANELKNFTGITINPSVPQVNMLHVYLPVTKERATDIRNNIAHEHGVWLFNSANHTALPNQCMFEWTVGDSLLNMPDANVNNALKLLCDAMASPPKN
ncbi:MAG: threonine aldolase [Burkholderiaceae bacterium]|nr:threonine aldolase [Burkholderiaceae bacterium]